MNLIAIMAMIDDPDELELFCTLYGKYDKRIFSYLYEAVGDFHAAEDLCQEVFFRLAKSISTVSTLSAERAKSYLYRIAKNVYFDYCEKSKRKPKTLEYVDLADKSADAESLLISEECVENIKKVIAEMPTSVRDALMLHYIDGINAKTIAEVQGKTVSAVKSEISRGTVKLLERIRCSNGYDK